jgi:4-aminobutyrate aminotransferase-like enzyme/Ser/Thr protein kinase RdoA (MazF antagonist)
MTGSLVSPLAAAHRPRFSASDAERLGASFGARGRARELTSERDQNFLIEGEAGGIVLKIANASEDRAFLDAQHAALRHIAGVEVVPRVVASASGAPFAELTDDDGRTHLVWAVSRLPGRLLAHVPYRDDALYEDLGRQTGSITAALAGFDHPAVHRDFYWDVAAARAIVAAHRSLIGDDTLGAAVDALTAAFDTHVAPIAGRLPRAVVHGDINDHNVLVEPRGASALDGWRVSGIVDFGDMVYSYRVADLAIAIAYAMLDADDPLTVAVAVVRGFSARVALDDAELAALFGLATMRLCASVCIAADQMRREPENEYLAVSQAPIRRLLPRLAAIPIGLAEVVMRDAAGRPAVEKRERVIEYLRRADPAQVLELDVRDEPVMIVDLSIDSPLLGGDPRDNDEPSLTERLFAAMADDGVKVAVGGYDEPRLVYVASAFSLGPRPTDEHRTIHIGLDLFAEAGTVVLAPLDGTVHAFADNAFPQDYGPVIILRHETDGGDEFFTLFGHLSRESLAELRVGDRVRAGAPIATLGAPDVNGGWTPHLHMQVMLDLLGLGTDFPGVATPSRRRAWIALCPDPNLLVRVPESRFPPRDISAAETLGARRASLGGNLSVAYKRPVKIVRGWMQYLYDDEGRCFIDGYNNVPHVGHCHPRVVAAGIEQMRVLNTNTRYLHDKLAAYSEKLLATLPRELQVCYFVNSASEANELALRLARAYTGAKDTIVLEAAYHGNTTSLIDISPYKHAGPGGSGAPDWVHVAPLADDYRLSYKRNDSAAGARYAARVGEIVASLAPRNRRLAAFIAETCPSVGGQLVFPPGYLRDVYRIVREAGGLCVADEVQTGLGRMGTSFWAFDDQGVVPDIVVMGKPLGNGHPIGAVATTRAIADAFDNGMEFFSTFGGNTVSCAIGMAVLDVVREEKLQEHARRVGDGMLADLRALAERNPLIGDVRGSGLFLGVELVRDRDTLEPATAEASFIVNRMRERGVLIGTDGPYHNVLKIRPPMPFGPADATLLVEALEASIRDLPLPPADRGGIGV